MDRPAQLQALLELANNYPSPHNGQPMRLEVQKDGRLSLFFDTARGLTATPISYLFSFVSIGVFIRHFELCAVALGHQATVTLSLPEQAAMAQPGSLHCALISIAFDTKVADPELQQVIERRQTSRKKYQTGLSQAEEQATVTIAKRHGIVLKYVNQQQAKQVIWLNQRAVFDDMFNPAVRAELDHWLRYDALQKQSKQDGLAYDCMELSGRAMRFSVRHYQLLHWPIIAPLVKKYYLRTMQDSSSVGYLTAPFVNEQEAYEIGRCIIELWLELAGNGQYLHPFGTIVSNDQAHADFMKVVGLQQEHRDKNYVAFIFRAGTSSVPVESERIPIRQHLYNEGQ